MEIWHVFLGIVVLVALAAILKSRKPSARTCEYTAAPILTKGEKAFAVVLEQTLQPGMRLLAKVRAADLLKSRNHGRDGAFLKISQKHLDFVITDSEWNVLAAIELNDKSHDTESRRARDAFMAEAFKGAGIPLHFVRASARYDAERLGELLPQSQAQPTR